MTVRLRPLLVGTATYLPGLRHLTARRTGGTASARYCYSVWLRHLVMAHTNGIDTRFDTVAELGPGDSLGMGIAALLSGAQRYRALDVVRYAERASNIAILDELVEFFRSRAPIPGEDEFPLVKPLLPSYDFPHHILTDERLAVALDPQRLASLRDALHALDEPDTETPCISYVVPWNGAGGIKRASVDFIFSQAVLQYPPDLDMTYRAMDRWLKPGGAMSHDIDFKCHGTTREWSGHWTCSDNAWSLVNGRRRDALNRAPHSAHIGLIRDLGCEIVCDQWTELPVAITRAQLAPHFRHLTDDDLAISSAFIQARKPL
ncbi:MAG: class I SAM-dependent methyltransferase [Chloroflexota bacterium]|nr:class I SAM-dependent methyltransferase [Chloroflexota bacterium]